MNDVIKEFYIKFGIFEVSFKRPRVDVSRNYNSKEDEAFLKVPFIGAPSLKLQQTIRNELELHGLRV